jgi:diguanylate cyclase (GGDEF)-like protein
MHRKKNTLGSILIQYLEKQPQSVTIILSVVLVFLISIIDYLVKNLSLSIFYLAPITLATWFVGRRWGQVISVLSAFVGVEGDFIVTYPNIPNVMVFLWDAVVKLGFFLVINHLLLALKNSYEREKQLARTDGLTGIVNRRFFLELLQAEMSRSMRYNYPLTLAYIDLDNFKSINDEFGHSTGDKLLCLITKIITKNIRTSDIVARLGGDEFALLLPQTNFEQAQNALPRVWQELTDTIKNQGWGVGFSIGAVTFVTIPDQVDNLIDHADKLMYTIKKNGKNRMEYSIFDNSQEKVGVGSRE